eukprot:1067917-Rhodomonas_salina.1
MRPRIAAPLRQKYPDSSPEVPARPIRCCTAQLHAPNLTPGPDVALQSRAPFVSFAVHVAHYCLRPFSPLKGGCARMPSALRVFGSCVIRVWGLGSRA